MSDQPPVTPAFATGATSRERMENPLWRRIARLAGKELRETLRDRRTLLTLLLMPLLLYPLLSLSFQRFVLVNSGQMQVEYLLGCPSPTDVDVVRACLQLGSPKSNGDPQEQAVKPGLAPKSLEPALSLRISPDWRGQLLRGEIDLCLRVVPGVGAEFDPRQNVLVDLEIFHRPDSNMSQAALEYVQELLQRGSRRMLRIRLLNLGIEQRPDPVRVVEHEVRNPAQQASPTLATLVPIILILMTITGAVYPAIDLTAGERERGTLEMLVAAPIPRLGLLFAKYVAVVTVAFLTATINLIAMTVTLLSSGLGAMLFGERGLAPETVLQVFALLLLFAVFFSAVLLALTSIARSFKEAQAYLIPLMLVSLGPGLIGLMPGIQLRGGLAIAPLLNVVLLSRDLLLGQAVGPLAWLVVGSTLLYAVSALAIASRIFGSHAILYESQAAWIEIFQRPRTPRPAPLISTACLCLAFLFPACYLLKNSLALLAAGNITWQIALTGASTVTLFFGLPLWAAWQGRVPLKLAFALRWPAWWHWPLAVCAGVAMWPFAHELVVGLHELGIVKLQLEQLEAAARLIEQTREVPLPLVLCTFALFPAFAEEWCFRGYLFRALESRLQGWQTVLVSGLAFGLFHLVAVDALAVERLAPTTLLGCILGWIRWRTGSLWPGVVVHACHNGLLTLAFYYADNLKGWQVNLEPSSHLPISWLMIAGGLLLLAGSGFQFLRRRQTMNTN